MGEAPDYAELAVRIKQKHGKYFFRDYMVQTRTYFQDRFDPGFISIGHFTPEFGMGIHREKKPLSHDPLIGAVPLIFPV